MLAAAAITKFFYQKKTLKTSSPMLPTTALETSWIVDALEIFQVSTWSLKDQTCGLAKRAREKRVRDMRAREKRACEKRAREKLVCFLDHAR